MAKGHSIDWKPEHIAFIKKHQANISRKALYDEFRNHFDNIDSRVNLDNFKGLIKRLGLKNKFTGKYKPGSVPFNKGTKGLMKPNSGNFKKGHVPHNHKPVGSERVTEDGYIMVKTKEPNVYRLKSRVVWESANGPLPEGYVIRFLDNNPLNCSLDNLMSVSLSVNATTNTTNPANTGNPEINKAKLLTETLKYETKKVKQ